MNDQTIEKYLRELDTALDGISQDVRRTIVDDLRAHAADALEEGRDPAAVVAALGTPAEVARETREALGIADTGPALDTASRAGRMLHWCALTLAVVTAVFASFLLPLYETAETVNDGDSLEQTIYTSATLFEQMGIGVGLLPLIPAALTLLPLLLPVRWRGIAGWAVAGLTVVFAFATGFSIGAFYAPLALLLGAAMLVPLWIRRGRRPVSGRVWRVVGALFLAFPATVALGGLVTGSVQDAAPPLWIAFIAVLLIAVLFALRLPYLDALVALLGVALMLLGIFDGGMLLIAVWWAGGLWLGIGLSGIAARGGLR